MANSRKNISELFPLCEELGKILDQICLTVGISYDDFFRHLADKIGNDGGSRHTRSYKKRVPQTYLLDHFSVFASAVDGAVKSCGADETIINRRDIIEKWIECGEGFLEKLCQVNLEARKIVLSLKYE